jgi:hypothetical protein
LRDAVDEAFGEAVAEVFGVGVAADIFERKDGEGVDGLVGAGEMMTDEKKSCDGDEDDGERDCNLPGAEFAAGCDGFDYSRGGRVQAPEIYYEFFG